MIDTYKYTCVVRDILFHTYDHICSWCDNVCGPENTNWFHKITIITEDQYTHDICLVIEYHFKNSSDAVMFKMKFGG